MLVERFPEFVALQDILDCRDEIIVHAFGNINAFNAATALTGVEDGSIHYFFRCPFQIYVFSNVGWIFSSQLKSNRNHTFCRGALYL